MENGHFGPHGQLVQLHVALGSNFEKDSAPILRRSGVGFRVKEIPFKNKFATRGYHVLFTENGVTGPTGCRVMPFVVKDIILENVYVAIPRHSIAVYPASDPIWRRPYVIPESLALWMEPGHRGSRGATVM